MYSQHHGYRTDDQDECHYAHESQGKIGMARSRKCIEHYVWIRPEILAETYRSIRDQECTKCKRITHQEIPHHQFSILKVEGAFTSTPPFCLMRCCCCRHVSYFNL